MQLLIMLSALAQCLAVLESLQQYNAPDVRRV